MKQFSIAGISFVPELWQPKRNLRRLLELIDEAAKKGAQVIATPEGILDGYLTKELKKHGIREIDKGTRGFRQRMARFKAKQVKLAKQIADTCLRPLCAAAAKHKAYLFVNTLDLRGKQSVFNTTFVISAQGKIVGKYDKIHAGFEVVNTLGRGYPVFKTPYAPIGVLICADRQFPETARCVALSGARVLIINSYGMWGEGANERFIRQRAYENGLFVLFCHPRETVLVSPEGKIIAGTCVWEHSVVRAIDPAEAIGRGVFGNRAMARTYHIRGSDSAYAQRYRENLQRNKKEAG